MTPPAGILEQRDPQAPPVLPVGPAEPALPVVEIPPREAPNDGLLRMALIFLLPFVVLFGARALVAEPFFIPSTSMSPTLDARDHVVANKLAYRVGSPRVGDVVVLESPRDGEMLVKRIVAFGGQTVEIRDGVLFVDGRPRREAYVDYDMVDGFFFGPARVAPGAVFVMGDQRGDSEDSRDFGSVTRDQLVGRVDLRIWPIAKFGTP